MPRSEEVLSIFLASPGDVPDERSRFSEIVANWNRAWSRNLGLRLELLRWEDDAYPDIGNDAQDVINQQIPADWDIFVGVMWARFGTPTGRAGSGTKEEFDRALERHRSSPGSISLLFYFKDEGIPPSKMDLGQLQQVHHFKTLLRSEGLLTWDFSDTDQFEKFVGLHITKHVQEWRKRKADSAAVGAAFVLGQFHCSNPVLPEPMADAAEPQMQEESGYLDLIEQLVEQSAEIERITLRLTAAQQELSEYSNRGRKELYLMQEGPSKPSIKKFRDSIARVAEEMLKFAGIVNVEVPNYRAAMDGNMNTLTRLAAITAELYPEQIGEMKASTLALLQNLISARQSTEGFRDSTSAMPRMTKELNVAKREQVAALTSLIAEFENGEILLAEGLNVISGLTGGSK